MHHDPNTERQLLAFLHLLAGYRDEAADIYNAMANGYDQFAATWDETFAGDAIEHLLQVCQENAPLRPVVLDAGCGTGRRIPDLLTSVTLGKCCRVESRYLPAQIDLPSRGN